MLKNHRNFDNISPYLERGLGAPLIEAAKEGHVDVIKELMSHPNYNNIPADGPYGLEAAFRAAEFHRDDGVIEMLKIH